MLFGQEVCFWPTRWRRQKVDWKLVSIFLQSLVFFWCYKSYSETVSHIDCRRQFHQHAYWKLLLEQMLWTSTSIWTTILNPTLPGVNFINIYARVFRTKFWRQSRNVTRKAAKTYLSYEKRARLTLMKLTTVRSTRCYTQLLLCMLHAMHQ